MAKNNSWHSQFCEVKASTGGGNAKVYFVKDKSTGEQYALKELRFRVNKKHYKKETKIRFKNEISIVKENASTIPGIIPIIEVCEREYWYTMPIAEPIMKHIENKGIEEIVLGVIKLSETLELLHDKGVSHRDIKPANIYYFNDRFYFGDFGLVDFPDNFDDLTRTDRGLGAIFTIAPEMKRNPKNADGKKADVFSLAKTMWMFLSKDQKGFDGVYNYLDLSHSLRNLNRYRDTHLVELEELLRDATDNSPDNRPTIKDFKERLQNWHDIYLDNEKSQASDWNFLKKQLFGQYAPPSSSWSNLNHVIEILNIIGKTPAYNHMLFHHQGGLDFSHAEPASENGCIKLYDTMGFCYIVKPKVLHFEGFDDSYDWNYFLLEFDELKPIIGNDSELDYEYLVEDTPAHYVSAQYAQYGVYDYDTGIPLPEKYQEVRRYTKGKFLIVLKQGPYNSISGTYDGRHGDCSAREFRDYIQDLINRSTKYYNIAKHADWSKNLSDREIKNGIFRLKEFNNNPFKQKFVEQYDNEKLEERPKERKKSRQYIKENFNQWNFKTVLQPYESASLEKIKFAFEFNLPNDYLSFEALIGEKKYVCTDGYIKKVNPSLANGCYFVYSREEAISLKNKLEQKISEFLRENNLYELEESESYFSIKLIKSGEPTHLFTEISS